MGSIFSFQGQIGRGEYIKFIALVYIVLIVVASVFGGMSGAPAVDAAASPEDMAAAMESAGPGVLSMLVFGLIMVVGTWASFALGVKRLRDAGLPPILVVLNLFVGPLLTLFLCVYPSKQ